MKKIYHLLILFSIFIFVGCSDDPGADPNTQTDDEVIDPNIPDADRLPRFYINTNGATIIDEPKIDASLSVIEAGEETFSGMIGIEIRGSSSQMFPKKSYGFETRDANNEDIDASILGYPEEEDWILYAPYSDKSLIRNMLIYQLSNDIGRYTTRTRLADVFINDNYNGLYVFMEKLKRDDNRIDINNLKEDEISGEDLTGGYIIKLDKADGFNETNYNSTNSFQSNFDPPNANNGQKINFLYDDPDQDDITIEQKAYISGYIADFENALASEDFTNDVNGYPNYIDTSSFIDFFLLNEVSNNVDGYRLSTWLTKDKNERLKMGPIWDFNLAFGNANYCGGEATDVWTYKFNERCPDDAWQIPFWWNRLLEDPDFVNELKARWSELRASQFSRENIYNKIDNYIELMEKSGSISSNFGTWPVLGTYVWPNNFIGSTYGSEIEYLKNWIDARLLWLDGAIISL